MSKARPAAKYQSSLSEGRVPSKKEAMIVKKQDGLDVHADICNSVTFCEACMFEVEFESVFSVLELLPVVCA